MTSYKTNDILVAIREGDSTVKKMSIRLGISESNLYNRLGVMKARGYVTRVRVNKVYVYRAVEE